MNDRRDDFQAGQSGWYREEDCRLDDFVRLLTAPEAPAPLYAARVTRGIPVYECSMLNRVLSDAERRDEIQRAR